MSPGSEMPRFVLAYPRPSGIFAKGEKLYLLSMSFATHAQSFTPKLFQTIYKTHRAKMSSPSSREPDSRSESHRRTHCSTPILESRKWKLRTRAPFYNRLWYSVRFSGKRHHLDWGRARLSPGSEMPRFFPAYPRPSGILAQGEKLYLLSMSLATRVQSFTPKLFQTIYKSTERKCLSLISRARFSIGTAP